MQTRSREADQACASTSQEDRQIPGEPPEGGDPFQVLDGAGEEQPEDEAAGEEDPRVCGCIPRGLPADEEEYVIRDWNARGPRTG